MARAAVSFWVSGLFPCSSLPTNDKNAMINFQPTEVSAKTEAFPHYATPLLGGQGCFKTRACLGSLGFLRYSHIQRVHSLISPQPRNRPHHQPLYVEKFCGHLTASSEMQVLWKSFVCFSSKTNYFPILTGKKCSLFFASPNLLEKEFAFLYNRPKKPPSFTNMQISSQHLLTSHSRAH